MPGYPLGGLACEVARAAFTRKIRAVLLATMRIDVVRSSPRDAFLGPSSSSNRFHKGTRGYLCTEDRSRLGE